ncbi:MAG: glycosyltransferase [Planctomycetota bacterium]
MTLATDSDTAPRALLLSECDIRGGANVAANRLHEGLKRIGSPSEMLVRRKLGDDPSVRSIDDRDYERRHFHRGMSWWLQRKVRRHTLGKSCDAFTAPRSSHRTTVDICNQYDIVNFHWITYLVDWPTFFQRCNRPIVWTTHDMNAFTGGCHYNGPCDRYLTGCGRCPELNSDRDHDPSKEIFRQKRRLFESLPAEKLTFVAPSRWLESCIRSSPLLDKFEVHRIPYGLDTESYQITDAEAARKHWGIEPGQFVVLFIAASTKNHRKGLDLLVQSLSRLEQPESVTLLCVGGSKPENLPERSPLVLTGRIDSQEELVRVYNAADCLVLPSRQDNLPNTVLEAIACGTPVVGFETGGVPDMIRPDETGVLCSPIGVDSLTTGIESMRSMIQSGHNLRDSCRRIAESEYGLKTQAESYRELYARLMQDCPQG